MAVVAIMLGWLVAGRVLRPLRRITEAANEISATNLHERLAVAGPNDELKRLGDTMDNLLARLEGAFDAQRRFVANASHELRTPLTLIRALLQMTLTDPHATIGTFRSASVKSSQSVSTRTGSSRRCSCSRAASAASTIASVWTWPT
jgi:signal transduction histidine kinase